MEPMELAVTKKNPAKRMHYNFGRLKERGDFFFIPGDGNSFAHRVRQAAFSFMKFHPDLEESGDRLSTLKEVAEDIDGVKDDTPGAGVYRVAING